MNSKISLVDLGRVFGMVSEGYVAHYNQKTRVLLGTKATLGKWRENLEPSWVVGDSAFVRLSTGLVKEFLSSRPENSAMAVWRPAEGQVAFGTYPAEFFPEPEAV